MSAMVQMLAAIGRTVGKERKNGPRESFEGIAEWEAEKKRGRRRDRNAHLRSREKQGKSRQRVGWELRNGAYLRHFNRNRMTFDTLMPPRSEMSKIFSLPVSFDDT